MPWEKITDDTFRIGTDDFSSLEISPTPIKDFFYFFYKKENRLIKRFVLLEKKQVDYLCNVILIKKDNKFSPRLEFSTRDKSGKITEEVSEETSRKIKARISLEECHDNFWKLITFIQSLRDIEIPKGSFSLVSEEEGQIISAIRGRDVESVQRIIKELSKIKGVSLSDKDIAQILNRKGKLSEFQKALSEHSTDENWWQDFFEENKWIFGYGLNYEILRQEQAQPNYGGTKVDGKGGQRGDYLTSTLGDVNFTVLLEIKTPETPLLQGTEEIRNGAWSYSKNLTDAVSQIQANIDMWEKDGSTNPGNRDRLEGDCIYTVQPKGILIIGKLSELDTRNKKETFQRLRRSIHGVDILTFDELLKRAEFIVEEKNDKEDFNKNTKDVGSDNKPF